MRIDDALKHHEDDVEMVALLKRARELGASKVYAWRSAGGRRYHLRLDVIEQRRTITAEGDSDLAAIRNALKRLERRTPHDEIKP